MNTPDPELMKRYGTEEVFKEKSADSMPFLARMTAGLLGLASTEDNQNATARQDVADVERAEAAREFALLRMQRPAEELRHTRVPMFVRPGDNVPAGWDEGMVRLASIAVDIGADRAKEAGIGDFVTAAKAMSGKAIPALKSVGAKAMGMLGGAPKPPPSMMTQAGKWLGGGMGLKTNVLLGAGALGAGALASRGLGAAAREMGRPSEGPATYGGSFRGVGYELPFGTNGYGVPQVGTAL